MCHSTAGRDHADSAYISCVQVDRKFFGNKQTDIQTLKLCILVQISLVQTIQSKTKLNRNNSV